MRPLSVADAESMYSLNLDPEVLKYTGDKPFGSLEAAHDFLTSYDQYEKYGTGRFAVIEKTSSKFIGWCGLNYSTKKNEYDLGFRFFRQYWNQGFATETAKKCIDYGFDHLGLSGIIGRARKENLASIRVLEKAGMSFRQTFDFEEHEGVIYELIRFGGENNG
jgi:RimJ/RimL family protein N-acetyltransferase